MSYFDLLVYISQTDLFEALIRYMITLLGSFTMYLLSISKGFEGSVVTLKRLFPQKKKVFYDRLDFFLVVFLGSAIGTIFFNPQDSIQALAAGFGWVGAVNILLNQKERDSDNE